MAYLGPSERLGLSLGGNSTSAGAGYQYLSSGSVILAGGNNITLSQNGNSLSIVGGGGGGGVALSAAGASASNGTVVFSNSNGIGFGMNGSTITASHNGLTSQSNQAFSASGGSSTFQTLSFSGGNGITFTNNAGQVGATVQTNYAASNHSHGNPTLNLTNLSGTTASASNGLTISLSAAAPGGGGGAAISAAGASASNGTVVFSNSNGVGFGMNGSTVTASHNGITSQSNQIVTAYAGSNTYSASSGTLNASSMRFVGSGNVSVGVTNGSVMISGGGGAGGVAMANAETTYTSGTVNLVGDGPVSVYSAANQSYRVSIPGTSSLSAVAPFGITTNGATISLGLTGAIGGGLALANSQTTYTSGTANLLAAGGALTIASTTGQQFNFSVPATSSLSATGALSISTNGSTISIGAPAQSAQTANLYVSSNSTQLSSTAGVDLRSLSFQGAGNISVGVSEGKVLISGSGGGGGGVTYSYFNPQDAYLQTAGQHGQGTLHLQPTKIPNVTFDRIVIPVQYSHATNTTASVTASFWFGIYTRTSASFSRASSTSVSYAFVGSGTANSASYNGIRNLTLASNGFIGDDQYYIGIISRTTTGGNNASFSQIVASQQNSSYSGIFGQITNSSGQYTRGLGYYSASTTGMPASIAMSELRGMSSMALRQPLFYFVNSTF